MRLTTSFAALLVLTACGGGGGGTGLPGPDAFSEIIVEHRDLESIARPLPITTTDVTPPTSLATYDGFILFDTEPRTGTTNPPGQVHYSRISLGVDFDNSTLAGTANEFWYYDEEAGGSEGDRVGGEVTVSSNLVRFDDPATPATEDFPLVMSGNLEIDGSLRDINTGSSLVEGTFAGDLGPAGATNARFLAGRGDTDFTGGYNIPTRIITEIQ